MKNNKILLILTISLFASIILAACGTQATTQPAEASTPLITDPKPVPATEVASETEAEEAEEPVATASPAEASADAPVTDVSFANEVLPIIESRCVNCHGGRKIEEGLLMRTYDEIMAGSDNGAIVIPGDVEGSLLVELVATKEMPKKGPKLTPPQIQTITDWVAAGAPNN